MLKAGEYVYDTFFQPDKCQKLENILESIDKECYNI